MTTRELEMAIFKKLRKIGTYICFEVMMPSENNRTGINNERVDLITYEKKGIWRFYELKITKQDYYSKNKHTFRGHFNYYVLPDNLYDEVKHDIAEHIGVYLATDYGSRYINGRIFCECVKKAKKQPLCVDNDKLKFAFMQALSREHDKYRHMRYKLEDDIINNSLIKKEGKCKKIHRE